MSTIAYRNGIMAADSGAWYGESTHGWAKKLAKGSDGTLYGLCGNAAESESFRQWVLRGCLYEMPQPRVLRETESSFIVLRVQPDKVIELITAFGVERYEEAPYYSIGAGAAACWGALYMGATAVQALDATMAHGCSAMGKVQTIEHG